MVAALVAAFFVTACAMREGPTAREAQAEAAPPVTVTPPAAPPPSPEMSGTCGPRSALVAMLERRYQERVVAVAISDSGMLVEALTSDGGGTWTITMTRPDGLACVVMAGEGWRAVKPAISGPET